MNRLVLGMAAIIAGLSGCASPARYVERTGDTGVVAIPANTDSFPSYNRREAVALIQKHVGPNFEITEEREVATGKRTLNDQQVNNDELFNSQTIQNTTTTQDVTEWRIAYRRKASPLGSGASGGGAMNGLTPAGGTVPAGAGVQPAGGIVPSVGPNANVVPAGGRTSRDSGSGVYGSTAAFFGQMR